MHFNKSIITIKGNIVEKVQMYTSFYYEIAKELISWYNKNLGLNIRVHAIQQNDDLYRVKLQMPYLHVPASMTNAQYFSVQAWLDNIVNSKVSRMLNPIIVKNKLDCIRVFCADMNPDNCFVYNDKVYLLDLNAFCFAGFRDGKIVGNLQFDETLILIKYMNSIDSELHEFKEFLYLI